MTTRLRVFVAVPIPGEVAVFLRQIQAKIQLPATDIRWVAQKNIHLTVKFLGDIDPSQVPAIAAQMDAAAATIPPFRLVAKGVGVFPNFRRARVLWVGLAGHLDRLKTSQADLESALEAVGFSKEARDFSAHLTIGRVRRRIDAQRIRASLDPVQNATSDRFRVDRLTLIKSVLKPNGPRYSLLHTSHLAASHHLDGS